MPTNPRSKCYVGLRDGKRYVFRSASTPTQAEYGDRYTAVIGPFRTRRAAILCAVTGRYGLAGHVRDYEKQAAKETARRRSR